jgi:integrase
VRKALTAVAVEQIKPPRAGQIEIFDRGYPGFVLRVSYAGSKCFAMFYRHAGKLRRLTLGWHPAMTLAEAREAWRDARRLVAMGQDPGHKPIKASDTVANVVEEWLRRDKREARASTLYHIRSALGHHVLPLWGGRDIGSITKREIHELLDGIVDRAPGSARSVHSHLRSLFRWSLGREIIAVDPMAGIDSPVAAGKRERVLSDPELGKVWAACGELGWPYGPCVQLLILTGARRSEIDALRWDEIVAGQIVLAPERVKTGESRVVPLSPQASELLAGVERAGQYVFGKKRAWSAAKARIDASARINEPWTIHDLRRTCATGMQRLKVSLQVVEAALGHVGTRAGIVGVYQKYDFLAEKRAALELWGAHVASLLCQG